MKEMRNIVLLLNPSRMYTRGLLSGIAKYAHLQGLWTFYRPLEYRKPMSRHELLKVLEGMKPDGIIMREPKGMDQIIKMGIPTVSFPYSVEFLEGVSNGVVNHLLVGKMAAQHFLDRGFQHFAFCGFNDWWWSCRRRQGFREVVQQAGYETNVYQLPQKSRRTCHSELPVIIDWLTSLKKPVGVMACNDDRGELVVEACKLAGIHVPDQVAIIGVDNDSQICELCSPPLSSVSLCLEKAGYESAVLLDRMITDPTVAANIIIEPSHVVTRQSTDIVAVIDKEVAAAIRFIRQQARANINVDNVVAHVSISRRVLEKRFRRILGKSIHDEIRRVRVDLIVKMLIETHMTIAEIAQAMNFETASHLSRYLKMGKGVSPLHFRKQHVG
jgi:LacI family transcriptional regulator